MSTSVKPATSQPTPAPEQAAEIFSHLDLWADQGLITPEQAAAIREFESSGGRGGPTGISQLIQALLYMGTALTLAALGTIYWQLYEELGQTARVAIPTLLAAALGTAGWFTARRVEVGDRRFGGVLWLLSTGAAAGALSELVMPDELAGDWSLLVVGAGAAIWAGILARLSPQATTQIGLFGPTIAVGVGLISGLTNGFAIESDIAWVALPLGLLGAGWIVARRTKVLRPTVLADVLGAALVLFAPTLLFGTNVSGGIALLLGSVVAGGLLGVSAWLRSTALLAVGAVGLYAYSFRAIWVYFGDTIGMPVVLLIGGLLLLGIAFGAIRLGGRRHT